MARTAAMFVSSVLFVAAEKNTGKKAKKVALVAGI
jgi:hypothetical protein